MGANLVDLIKLAIEEGQEMYSTVCTVKNVDLDNLVFDAYPVDEKAPILQVRLTAGGSINTIVQIPKEGSFCIVTFISKETAFPSMFSELEEILIRGDEFGGLIKIEELKSQLGVMTSRIDTLYKAISDAIPIAQDGGVGFQSTAKAILATQVSTEDFSEIENDTVKHG